jgi:putative two-component system response regulator
MSRPLILLVEPDPVRRRALRDVMAAGLYQVLAVETPEAASNAAMVSPQLVALSLLSDPARLLPFVEGWRNEADRARIPLLAFTPENDLWIAEAALSAGADEALPWPMSPVLLRARLRSLVNASRLQAEVGSFGGVLASLSRALEAREPDRFDHSNRVAEIAAELAHVVGLSEEEVGRVRQASLIHDIGYVAIPDRIVFSSSRLSTADMALIRSHPVVGHEMLRGIPSLEPLRGFVHRHHERIDGSGYPDGLSGREIPVPVQVLSLADAYDAMTSSRPYRPPFPHARALETLWDAARRGVFDVELVRTFTGTSRHVDLAPPALIPARRAGGGAGTASNG